MPIDSELESSNEVTLEVNPGEPGLINLVLRTHADERVGFAIIAEFTTDQATQAARLLASCPPGSSE